MGRQAGGWAGVGKVPREGGRSRPGVTRSTPRRGVGSIFGATICEGTPGKGRGEGGVVIRELASTPAAPADETCALYALPFFLHGARAKTYFATHSWHELIIIFFREEQRRCHFEEDGWMSGMDARRD